MPTATCSCGAEWHQSGNRTGHCSGCHRTFSGISTFDAHRHDTPTGRACADPADLLDKAGMPKFKTYVDRVGTTVWRSAKDRPEHWKDGEN